MGYPLTHSLSPKIHQMFAAQFNLVITYDLITTKEDKLTENLSQFIANGGSGLNITAPLKEILFQRTYLPGNNLSLIAQYSGSVNTITIQPDGSLYGENTDGIGLVRDLLFRHAIIIKQKHILILGAGGAARGIICQLLEQQPASISIVTRDSYKARAVAINFAKFGEVFVETYNQLKIDKFDLVINATATSFNDLRKLCPNIMFSDAVYYDLNYRFKNNDSFAKPVINGLGMLVEQAAEAFYIWHGQRPITDPVMVQLQSITDQILAGDAL